MVGHFGGRDSWDARSQSRLWQAGMVCCASLPMMFMGGENYSDGWWHTDAAHWYEGLRAAAPSLMAVCCGPWGVRGTRDPWH